MSESLNISLKPQNIFTIMGLDVSDAMIAGFFTALILVIFSLIVRKNIKLIPGRLQVSVEAIIEFFLAQLENAWGNRERAKKYLPLVLTIFLFLLIGNQFTVIPFISGLTTNHIASNGATTSLALFRTPSSHFSLTLSFALATVIGAHIIAFIHHPIRHIGNFFKFHEFFKVRSFSGFLNAGLEFFLGLLDIIGEIAKIISLSARLFGNVFAGEVMIAVIAALSVYTTYLVPIPFIFLSIFSGVIQAFVFALLAVQFVAGIVQSSEPQTS